jgi:hypothetical protein
MLKTFRRRCRRIEESATFLRRFGANHSVGRDLLARLFEILVSVRDDAIEHEILRFLALFSLMLAEQHDFECLCPRLLRNTLFTCRYAMPARWTKPT